MALQCSACWVTHGLCCCMLCRGTADRLLAGTPSCDPWCCHFMSGLFGVHQGMGTDSKHERCELAVCNVITMCTWAALPSVEELIRLSAAGIIIMYWW